MQANTCGDSGSNYKARPLSSLIWSYDDILTNIKKLQESDGKDGHQIVDARPSGRFSGVDPEIRPGMSSGHMPFALNVPSSQVTKLSGEGGTPHLRSKDELIELFTGAGIDLGRPIVTTCGSGVTAAVLYMALLEAGAKRVAVYDGSWTEYAQKPESPIVKDA
ncbi:hypothetical protein EV182_000139 [Spiromyces aspiralis]|uniref:Uncharacterized protein n=1 Tax=Spiromyces aspiralis TaxID=68401 RepID=A0ACC1HVN4_9FUNG|nr:hypothetical protein EV182_000139 [Spiromyces aspiralis]